MNKDEDTIKQLWDRYQIAEFNETEDKLSV